MAELDAIICRLFDGYAAMRRGFPVALLVCCLIGTSEMFADGNLDARLHRFEKTMAAALISESRSDALGLAAVAKLEAQLKVADFPKLEAFAGERDGALAFAVMPIFVRHDQLDPVARLATRALKKGESREYRLWKWWETMFGERADFERLSKRLGLAFAGVYDNGDEATRTVIADIFGKQPMTAVEFRRFIETSGKGQK
ncbi:MAG: hypothetical protein NTV08_08070 [Verrucomicrobia bacterium]|nr:hypothetical protein [Verrucomicrobiota bacterium]